ncbi:Diamine acetyltransferase 1 [Hondaea fermentalgiana]|uniref:N-alpha-acetyltransferase 40 n=1 Tax=Hondaea fermentalgiana TaxID=2315210 RepID=A0A2R5GTM5_9STRA|nr:Diamine acetyltransferase 1 [Hondaea fermentalgiana]|eukprot:GBG34227.1 Diamine acetyltransferase 1 [Hondaea fermentalgiana]
MKPLYESVEEGPSAWDDSKKQQELFCQQHMLFLVVYSDKISIAPQGTDETNPLSVCADVLTRIVDRIVSDHAVAASEQMQEGPQRTQGAVSSSDGAAGSSSAKCGATAESAGSPPLRPDQIIGFVAFKTYYEAARWSLLYIHELQLVPEVRGRGVGAYLMENVEEVARKYRSMFLMLTVQDVNVGARRFYEKGGFTVDEACPSVCYQSEKVSYRIMSKVLDKSILRHSCISCRDVGFRYPESLTIHNCKMHGEPWPHRCRHPQCGLGTVKREQLRRHIAQHDESAGSSATASEAGTGFGLPSKMQEDTLGGGGQGGSEGGGPVGARRIARAADLLCQRVTLSSSGQTGMVIKTSGKTYTVRLDGDPPKTCSVRRSEFVVQVPRTPDALLRCVSGPDAACIDPNMLLPAVAERKKKDPDFMFAMALHYSEEQRPKRRRQVGVSS